jgi:diguanylate cyclase (GGDEF)-like protein
LLRTCGRVMAEALRATDIAARIGGDEFVAFLPETAAEDAVALCNRLLQALEESANFQAAGVTASIGIVIEDVARSDIDQLLQHADTRMYLAKEDGKGRIETHYL